MRQDELLETHTFKNRGMDTSRRTLEVLLQHERNPAKLLAMLIAKLEEKGVLNEADIDDILLNTI